MEDSDILDLYFAREERAIRETDHKYGKELSRLSYCITQDYSETEECVDDTYLAAWNQIPPDRPNYFCAYLCKIVRNLSLNLVDKRKAQKRNAVLIPLDEELLEILPDNNVPEIEERELARAIEAFLRKSDKKSRILFGRRYFYTDTMEDIAALAGMSVNAVTVKLSRIRKKLKVYLIKEEFEV